MFKKNIFRTPWNSSVRNPAKLWLDKNENNDFFLEKLYLRILKQLKFTDISAYPDLTETYKKYSKFLGVNKKQIFLTSGSDLAIKSIFDFFILRFIRDYNYCRLTIIDKILVISFCVSCIGWNSYTFSKHYS